MATTLTTEQYYNGTGSQTNFAFTFPYQKESDVKVEHPIGTVLTAKTPSAANDYEILTGTTIKFTTAPASGTNNVKVYRDTNVDSAHAIFSAGSSIRATDLNTNIEQLLFTKQDKIQASHITANTITNTHISDAAEIEVSKLKDGSARQILQTDSAGTGVEWTSNIDIPGSLDVTGNADIDGALNVDGAADVGGDFKVNTNKFTVAASSGNTVIAGNLDVTGQFDVTGTSNYTGQQTVPGGALVKDIRVGLDGNNEVSTASGNLVLDSASGTVQVTDHFNVTGNADVDVNLNVDGTLTVDGTSTLTGNVSVGGTVDGRDIAADGTKLDGIEAGATGDQTNAEIRAAVEAASDSNVFTDADHSKLNAIEAGATADQTAAEIRTAVEAASDSNVFTDADHSKLNAIEASATADQTAAEIRTLVEAASDSNVFTDADHSKLNAIEASATADQTAAEIKTLYESNANTNALTDAEKLVIDGVTANTSELNTLDGITASTAELNITTGMSKATSLTSTSNTEYPTSKAVNDRIVELMQASGGFFPIADDQSFPNANPDPNDDAGTIVSISDAGGLVINSSGVTTTGRTLGGATVTITGIDSSLHSTTIGAGKGMLVQTTSTLNTYTYHRLTLDEGGVASAQTLVSDFNQRYRIGPSNPTSSLDDGDLFFNTTSDTMLVYNATASNWDEVQTRGNYFINTLSSFSGTGGNSASFDNTAYKFGLSHAGASAQQHLVSINGVLQKPNAGTSVPSEGFALDGSTIIFSTPPPAGSDYFIVTIGASVNIGTPGNNSITSAMIIDGSIVNGDISNSAAIAPSKLAKPIDFNDGEKARFGTGNDLEIFHENSYNTSRINSTTGNIEIRHTVSSADEAMAKFIPNGAVEFFYDGSKKLSTASFGVQMEEDVQFPSAGDNNALTWDKSEHTLEWRDNVKASWGDGKDLQIYHTGSSSYISHAGGGNLHIQTAGGTDEDIIIQAKDAIFLKPADGEAGVYTAANGSTELYYDNSLKLSTASGGVNVAGNLNMNGADSYQLRLGANNDLKLYHDGTDNYIYSDNKNLYVCGNGSRISMNPVNAENSAKFHANGNVELYYDNSKKLETKSGGVHINNTLYLDDNGTAAFGNGFDLQIYHNGSHSFIDSTLAGAQLLIRTKESGGTTNNAAKFMPTGAVELYYDGSKKLETTNTGVTVTGGIIAGGLTYPTSDGSNGQVLTTNGSGTLSFSTVSGGGGGGATGTDYNDNVKVRFGTGNDLEIYHSGSYNYIASANTTQMRIVADAWRVRSYTGSETLLEADVNGSVQLNYDNSTKLETTSTGVEVTGRINLSDNLDMPDSAKIILGTGDDLKIYHDGSNNYINSLIANGDLIIDTAQNFYLKHSGEKMIQAVNDGAVQLYYDNSKKLETTADGIEVTGKIFSSSHIDLADNVQLLIGTGDDLQIYHSGSHSYILNSGTGNLYLQDNDYVEIGRTDEAMLGCVGNGAVNLYYDGSKKFETTSSGVSIPSDTTFLQIGAGQDLDLHHNGSHSFIRNKTGNLYIRPLVNEEGILVKPNGNIELYYDNSKKLETTSWGVNSDGYIKSSGSSGKFILDDSGAVEIGGSADLKLYHNGTHSYIWNTQGDLQIRSNSMLLLSSSGETYLQGDVNGSTSLWYDNSKKLQTESWGVRMEDELGLYDNKKLHIGTSNDLQIWHDATNSSIKNSTGTLFIRGADVRVTNAAVTEHMAKFYENGSVELYYDNSKKLETRSDGVEVFGDLRFGDNKDANFGNDADLKIYHDGGNSWIKEQGTGALYLDSYNGAGIFLTANNANENMITAYKDGAVNLYHNNSKKFETVSGGAKVTGDLEVTGSIAGGVGKILQVVTNTITGAQSGTNNSDSSENTTDLTGFSLNITPSSTSSKILLMATISQSSTNWSFMVHAYRDSTIIAKGDDLGGNRSEFTFCIGNSRDYNDATGTSTVHIIDSPSTTSQVTYKLKGCTRGSNSTWHINRSARHSQYNNAWIHSTVSTFTLMEIG